MVPLEALSDPGNLTLIGLLGVTITTIIKGSHWLANKLLASLDANTEALRSVEKTNVAQQASNQALFQVLVQFIDDFKRHYSTEQRDSEGSR